MKECKLTIRINTTPAELFQFALDPNNTPLWVASIIKEERNESPTKLGTIYKNVNKDGSTELEYFEWIDHGNLAEPFTQALLEKLRKVVESL